jgi:fermentation-respiration switch protein FrsA (DUF1100 family)
MQQLKNLIIPGSKDKSILADVFYLADETPKPVVIFVHGFKGFKDWGHFDLVAQTFAETGFVFIKFNFSHNGTTVQDPLNFGDLEAFGNNNYIIELDDLKKVMDWAQTYAPLKHEIDPLQLYLLGHSRGGGISILKAGEDHRVKKLVTWAAVSDVVNRNKQKTIETWKRDGVVYAKNGRTGQDMPLYYQFYEHLMANKERLNIHHAAKNLSIPFLIVHGTKDDAVPLHDAEELHKACKQSKLFIVEGAGHTFGVKHPFNGVFPEEAQEVLDRTIAFLKK